MFFQEESGFFYHSNVIQDQEDLTGMIKAYHFFQKQKIIRNLLKNKNKNNFIKNS